MFSSILLGSDKHWSLFSKTKGGNSVPPSGCLSSSLLLSEAENTIKVVVSGDKSESKVKGIMAMSHFGLKKGKKHYKNRGQKKGTIYQLWSAIFGRFFGPENRRTGK